MYIGEIVQYCSDPALGSLLSIIKRAFTLLEIAVPIVLMVGLAIPFFHMLTNPDDQKVKGHIFNALTGAAVVMLLPIIVNLVMFLLNFGTNSKFVVSECWNDSKVSEGKARYITKTNRSKANFLINPEDFKGVDTDPNYRADRVPDDDEDEEDYNESYTFGAIVWDPNDVTKTSNLTSAQLIKILNSHSPNAKNFIPYAQQLIAAEQKYSVNVFFLLGIDALESGWVTSSIAKSCNNLGGVTESNEHPSNGCGSNAGHKFAYFNSVGDYINYHAQLLHNSYLSTNGAYYKGKSVDAVQKKYCPLSDSGCEDWAPGVKKIANSLYKQAEALGITASGNLAEKVAKAAEYLAWPLGSPKSKTCRFNGGGSTPQFMKVYRKFYSYTKNSSDASVKAGTCCCHFGRTVVTYAIGKKVGVTLLPGPSHDESTRKEMAKHGFTRIKFDGKYSSLKRGDVLYYRHSGGGHVWIFLGDHKAAEAGHDSGQAGRITKVSNSKIKTSGKSAYYIFRATK